MHYKITTLVENAVYGRNLQAEHGLSLLIENNGYKILFDTGQSDLFIYNPQNHPYKFSKRSGSVFL